jgi:hypothetical protein
MEGSTPYLAHENPNQERNETMSLQLNDVAPDFDATDFEGVRPHLLDLVQSTTACSSTVFNGLLAWANLHTPQSLKRARAQQAHQHVQQALIQLLSDQHGREILFAARSPVSRLSCCQLGK